MKNHILRMHASLQKALQLLGPFGWTMGMIGTLASASAIISLVQHWSDIQLTAMPALYMTYYRGLMRSLVDWIPFPFHWQVPQWYLDALAINGVIAASAARATIAVSYHQTRLFVSLLYGSAFLLLAWVVAPVLIGFVNNFSRSTIEEANTRLSHWEPELVKLRQSHPTHDFSHIEKQNQGDRILIVQYDRFLAVRRLFVAGLVSIILATGAFYLLNGISPQAHVRSN
ncbi:hypothetical protein [Nitrospira sp. Nam74]